MRKLGILVLVLAASVFFSACNPLESKVKSGLQVLTNDIPASLFLNDEYLDKTPYINKGIKPGVYTLRIEPDDEELTPYETSVTLSKGLLTVLTWKPGKTPETSGGVIYEMEKLENKKDAQVSFVTIPDNAIISFDEGEAQFSPLLLEEIEPGHHEFEVKLPSYETQKHVINVVAGHKLLISVKMAKTSTESSENEEEAVIIHESDLEASKTSLAESDESEESDTDADITLEDIVEEDEEEESAAEESEEDTELSLLEGAVITIQATNFFVDEEEVLKVRDAAGTSGKELGFAPVGESYQYLDEEENGWYKIDYDGEDGWVSGKFVELSEE